MPAAVQDIAIVVSQEIPAESVAAALRTGAGELLESISLFDRYEAIGDGKVSLAFTLVFRAPDRTLTAEEVSTYRLAAAQEAKVQFGATLRD
jgi:phenylalanyl-tRNA synthetase beta chain